MVYFRFELYISFFTLFFWEATVENGARIRSSAAHLRKREKTLLIWKREKNKDKALGVCPPIGDESCCLINRQAAMGMRHPVLTAIEQQVGSASVSKGWRQFYLYLKELSP